MYGSSGTDLRISHFRRQIKKCNFCSSNRNTLSPTFSLKQHAIRMNTTRTHDFPDGGGGYPKGGERQPIIWPNFAGNCMKMKKTGPRGQGASKILLCRPAHGKDKFIRNRVSWIEFFVQKTKGKQTIFSESVF